jgi:hypothetical protein
VINANTGVFDNRSAFIDTAADITVLDESIATTIGIELAVIDGSFVRGVGGGSSEVQLGEVELRLLESPELSVVLEAVFVPGLEETVGNLIGLDVLAQFDIALSHGRNSGSIGRPFPRGRL